MSPRRYRIASPWGNFVAGFTDAGLSSLALPTRRALKLPVLEPGDEPAARRLLADLDRYLAGRRVAFDLPLDLSAGTDFQRKVWRRMSRIPYGVVVTYGEIARGVGRPGAARAVGSACGRNPVIIVVPCHRVVASGGIGGFGAGLKWKRRLLSLEGIHPGEREDVG